MRVLSSRSVVARQSRFFSSTTMRSSKNNEKKSTRKGAPPLGKGVFFFQLFFLRWWVHRSLGQKRDECEQKVQFFFSFDEKNFKFSPLLRAAFASSCTSRTSFTSSKTFSSRAIIISRERKRERERERAQKKRDETTSNNFGKDGTLSLLMVCFRDVSLQPKKESRDIVERERER